MIDIIDSAARSRNMAAIRAKNTAPEVALRKVLHHRGFRFRIHVTTLPGKPDIVLAKYRAAILVHGCFWHRHEGCAYTTMPASNALFWREKFDGTLLRDQRNLTQLRTQGWRTAVVWECALKSRFLDAAADRLSAWLMCGHPTIEIPAQGEPCLELIQNTRERGR